MYNRINNLSLKTLKTVYIWKIDGENRKLYHVCASVNGAAIFLQDALNSFVRVRVHEYLDNSIPIQNTFIVTTDLKYPTEEFVEQMKYLKKNN